MEVDDRFDPSGLTALVLDENHYERRISIEQLRAMGFGRVIGAGSTNEAWEALQQHNPNILMMEWVERSGDALGFVRRIRNTEGLACRALSIFMLTVRGRQVEVESARQAGADGFLRKPISALELKKRVRTVITQPQPFIITASYVGPCRRRRRDDLNYLGPRRRLDDPALDEASPAAVAVKENMARACVAALEARVRELARGDSKTAEAVHKAVQDLADVGERIADPAVQLGAQEMARYLKAQGASHQLDAKVVRTHVAALHQLVHLPHAQANERMRVAESLKRMVDKKLRQAAAA